MAVYSGSDGGQDLSWLVREESRGFSGEWLDVDAKTVVPLLAASFDDGRLATRWSGAAVAAGASHGLIARIDQGRVVAERVVRVEMSARELGAALPGRDVQALVALPDLSAALLFTGRGYALLAGNVTFVRACLDTGVDQARARFFRDAQRLGSIRPDLAEENRPHWRAWRTAAEVRPESSTARQLALMASFAAARLDGRRFVAKWMGARGRALDAGERLLGRFDELMNDVFHAIDDCALDPDLWERGDLTEEELRVRVLDVLRELGTMACPARTFRHGVEPSSGAPRTT
ncbi:hypothetical protein HII36_06290 [Nonomuraea sp. NN258]|uniref:hypothetical protein n=1 Tax=Nonomuraea antri TaxID=2730852 RepID=UPI001568C2DB|nr:hypothetical protein [Nonomuraea antri]NRQ31450.1 hypothetical protein [Nonomuraea antri]